MKHNNYLLKKEKEELFDYIMDNYDNFHYNFKMKDSLISLKIEKNSSIVLYINIFNNGYVEINPNFKNYDGLLISLNFNVSVAKAKKHIEKLIQEDKNQDIDLINQVIDNDELNDLPSDKDDKNEEEILYNDCLTLNSIDEDTHFRLLYEIDKDIDNIDKFKFFLNKLIYSYDNNIMIGYSGDNENFNKVTIEYYENMKHREKNEFDINITKIAEDNFYIINIKFFDEERGSVNFIVNDEEHGYFLNEIFNYIYKTRKNEEETNEKGVFEKIKQEFYV